MADNTFIIDKVVEFGRVFMALQSVPWTWDESRSVGSYPAINAESIMVATSGQPSETAQPTSRSVPTDDSTDLQPIHLFAGIIIGILIMPLPSVLLLGDVATGKRHPWHLCHDMLLSAHEGVLTIKLGNWVMMIGFSREKRVFIDTRFQRFVGQSHSQGSEEHASLPYVKLAAKSAGIFLHDHPAKLNCLECIKVKMKTAPYLVFPISLKSDAFLCFTDSHVHNERSSGCKLVEILSDNGTEFINSRLTDYCSKHSIKQILMVPNSSAQNGIVEHCNLNIASSMQAALILRGPHFSAPALEKLFESRSMVSTTFPSMLSSQDNIPEFSCEKRDLPPDPETIHMTDLIRNYLTKAKKSSTYECAPLTMAHVRAVPPRHPTPSISVIPVPSDVFLADPALNYSIGPLPRGVFFYISSPTGSFSTSYSFCGTVHTIVFSFYSPWTSVSRFPGWRLSSCSWSEVEGSSTFTGTEPPSTPLPISAFFPRDMEF
eukprot:Ihof_evm2s796 gene=Ihof_evmTU2s796